MESSNTDYAFRIFVAKTAWSEVVEKLIEEMDYDNFKSRVACRQEDAETDYEQALHEVWSVMNKLQK